MYETLQFSEGLNAFTLVAAFQFGFFLEEFVTILIPFSFTCYYRQISCNLNVIIKLFL